MLYDPKWQQISLTSFKDWLRDQPENGTYDWGDGETCVMARYLQSIGKELDAPMPDWYMGVSLTRPWTFGAALERAEAIS